jgi:spore photoproduct lyase
MDLYMPERAFFEPASLEYPLGRKLYKSFSEAGIEILRLPAHGFSRHIPGNTAGEKYARSKKTLAVTIKKRTSLDVCRPSADFQFELTANCPGSCEYCYLQTTQGEKPFLRVYVNLEDIFDIIRKHISKEEGRITTFEVASMGDPLSLEHLTGSLAETVEFFGGQENARLRVVTKYNNVGTLLGIRHNGHTRFRFSVNSRYVIDNFEHNTASFEERLEAASEIISAGYPTGFVVAPIMVYEGWREQYAELFERLGSSIGNANSLEPVTFELIQHRFTAVSKRLTLERFPNTRLDLDEEKRTLKWGRFGRYKYVYPKDVSSDVKSFITGLINSNLPGSVIEYFT